MPPCPKKETHFADVVFQELQGGPLLIIDEAITPPMIYLLGQWLNFKLFGITYLIGKINENKVQTFVSGFHSPSEYINGLIIRFISGFHWGETTLLTDNSTYNW